MALTELRNKQNTWFEKRNHVRPAKNQVSKKYIDPALGTSDGGGGLPPVTPNLLLHYDFGDASSLTLENTIFIAGISDLSGNGNDATKVSDAARPIYDAANGRVLLDKQDGDTVDEKRLLLPEANLKGVKAVFIVTDAPTVSKAGPGWGTYQDIIGHPGTSGTRWATNTGSNPTWNNTAGAVSCFINDTETSKTIDTQFPLPDRFVLSINNVSTAGTFSRLFNADGLNQQWEGHVYEILMYDGVLSAQEYTDVKQYLYTKYGIVP